ncbi:ubiquinol-cytochrome C chaperone [Haematospirillum jordaniae]|uniref:Ubiquinol-cytochrome c chaperone domain-containing protein n=1 Tax=Haematospirillum jordaniae TaxID=1549855 RepID=A0A143DF01_9PROT|nr:ubiquinol-cytochrome C chaperone family protein [Haematospirillum jordaniae]AMW35159.1 hypothetical protein AY555_08205 [Haematospirillum jordaniae]NKD46136.1 ubiquinol-cytochrome C chaperone [Haematospirillum jordaniae]NKD56452.1 ubiquinol-cytochrome C chaperone [Haematospirillum jordaniae]NKD58510.1 ubiquinol-cytochrome C chaperone [Haematospirillum jordaniae]NKD66321.1 ubiquinol-cytochrome C chaperone [Haematospirillum jordaniae]
MFSAFLSQRRRRRAAEDLYVSAVSQARAPFFFECCGVPDTVDGRFDMIALYVFLLIHRVRAEKTQESSAFAQEIFDAMFRDMDRNLREMGVGDLSVGKHIKGMAKAYYGRVAAYEPPVESGDLQALEAALLRNLYRSASAPGPAAEQVRSMAVCVLQIVEHMTKQSFQDVMGNRLAWWMPSTDERARIDA